MDATQEPRTVQEIDAELAERRAAMEQVAGKPTEVYSRIVGYYRSLRNWNHGKKSEFVERQTYTASDGPGGAAIGVAVEAAAVGVVRGVGAPDAGQTPPQAASPTVARLDLYTRERCPGCGVAKQLIGGMPQYAALTNEVDVDEDQGLQAAAGSRITMTPTLIGYDADNRELWRSSDPREMRDLLV